MQRAFAHGNAQLGAGYPLDKPAPDDVLHRVDRLKAYTKIIGLNLGGVSRAFPIDPLARVLVINEQIGTQPILVVHQGGARTPPLAKRSSASAFFGV
jgi:hypothetical protein